MAKKEEALDKQATDILIDPKSESVETLLGDVPQSIPEYLEIWGEKVPLEPLMRNIDCGCDRGAECNGLEIPDLHHLCVDMRNASGNLHWDKATGLPWIEFHTNFCCSVLNHVSRSYDWFKFGMTLGHYRRARMLMTGQAKANHEFDSPLFKHHISFQIPPAVFGVMMEVETREEFAKINNMSDEEAVDALERIAAWQTVDAIVGRITTSCRHEITSKYVSKDMMRMWKGEFKRIVESAKQLQRNPFHLLPLMIENEEGKFEVRGLIPGNMPQERELLNQTPLIEAGSGMKLLRPGETLGTGK